MKKFVLSLAILLIATFCAPVSAQTPRCNVGADPVNASRQPTADEEVIPNPADKSIVYASGNGKSVRCTLQAGVPVVVNKSTGVVQWVYGCGNPVLTPLWIPKRLPAIALVQPMLNNPVPTGTGNVHQTPLPASSSSINIAIYNEEKDRQQEQPWQPVYVAPKQHHYGLIAGVIIAGGGAVAIVIVFATRGHSKTSGTVNTGGVQ